MNAPSLAELEHSGCARADNQRLVVRIPTDWPADGEKRIGYVSILRLAEATRELHWRLDIAQNTSADDVIRLDSITKSVTAEFIGPVLADTEITCSYALTWVRRRSYGLRVTLSGERGDRLAEIDLTSVFIDPGTLRPVPSEPGVAGLLRARVRAAELAGTRPTGNGGPA